ncbi:glycoside hydrolase family 2 TIM barrel-domain containing protein [Agromyces sp. H66]|uniref:glycoside hydrolase family 2 protein n=1 Tax=Agromyces sp. H66 TaxID=2529859 RepID=UPI0010AB4995|nr:glycoside hydrolase family 2 TIM barrel-domain containing protein [Agromyces sp. H66]
MTDTLRPDFGAAALPVRQTDASAASVIPKPEYPRPDRDRSDRWQTLNGSWRFESIDGVAEIAVPFAWETPASGIGRTWLEHATYSREVTVPADWTDARVVLCFGAVHHRAVVSIDGVVVGEHVGGTTSFEFDITDGAPAGSTVELRVEVEAPADKRAIPHGKQRSIPRDDYDGVSFTPTSGIWQSVWLEARGRTLLDSVALRGDSLSSIAITGRLVGDAPVGARVVARVVEGSDAAESIELIADRDGVVRGELALRHPRRWSPADPHLYAVEFTTGEGDSADRVIVTTGLRTIETRGEHLLLNGERLYFRGVLDQGYWPETGLTAPTGAALLADLDHARDLGFTLVRKHLKFEEPRWLHEADRMGMLVWAEPPCPSRYSPEASAGFEAQLAPMVERDGNHPSIVIWGLYNEEWGLDWDIPGSPERADAAAHAYDTLRALDDSRPIVENSGWAHVRTDLVDWHYYDEDPAAWAENVAGLAAGARSDWPVKLGPEFVVDKPLAGTPTFSVDGVPIVNSEYGAGFTSLERAWHVRWQTQELRRHDRFAGYVYTELTDVEHEMAGLLTTARHRKDWGGLDPAHVNADTVLVVDLVPKHAGADIEVPTEPLELAVHVSHHGTTPVAGTVRAAWVRAGRPFPADPPAAQAESHLLEAMPFALSDAAYLTVPPPSGPARLLLWFAETGGRVLARTFVDAAPIEPPNRRGARPVG